MAVLNKGKATHKKAWESPVTRPTSRGSGIALSVWTSNAEAHADMYINGYDCIEANNGCLQINVGYNIPMDVIVALFFDR